jgi:hypothetical protein
MNIDFTIHRHGEWTMLVLGESILSLLIVDGTAKDYFLIFYSGMITVILLQYLHFRSQPHDPDCHAMRRDKNAGIVYSNTFVFYSAALIVVGVSYKMFLFESSYDKNTDHRLLRRVSVLPPTGDENNRWLAATGVISCGPGGDEKEQNIAHLFCGAMAIVFFCMDVTVLAHVGVKKEVGKCKFADGVCTATGKKIKHFNHKGIILVVFRCAITIFMATLSQWITDPSNLAEIGLAAVVCQLVNRFLGDLFFPEDEHYGHSQHHHREGMDDEYDEEYDEEYKWPNVTHAQAIEK